MGGRSEALIMLRGKKKLITIGRSNLFSSIEYMNYVRLLFDLQFALQIDQMESMFVAQFQIALNPSEFWRAQN